MQGLQPGHETGNAAHGLAEFLGQRVMPAQTRNQCARAGQLVRLACAGIPVQADDAPP